MRKVQQTAPYKNGLLEGELVRYHANGEVRERIVYSKGKQTELPQRYDERGKKKPRRRTL